MISRRDKVRRALSIFGTLAAVFMLGWLIITAARYAALLDDCGGTVNAPLSSPTE